MLNEKITDNTPMVEVLEEVDPDILKECTQQGEDPQKMAQTLISELFDLQNTYRSAIKEVSTKLEILNDEFQNTHERNPIHSMSSRVKSPKSIVEKLKRKGHDVTCESAIKYLDDIAGVRIICPYIEDIYTIKNLLKSQDDIDLIRVTDYIANPKPNGYRSLHLIVRLPVFFSDHKELVKVEVQIRTIAMDFWASLEHQLRYKAADPENVPKGVSQSLKECADTIAETDMRMQDIHNQVIR
ncbi:MAG: GTP pyrophosphokinase family protein [Eubacteriaceae bacterium]|nr:GTP pyrophosphokinase family protein [Eubacteriaceae bacterium]MDD4507361.1 GTP pyrophosphokinase family protein [Eubacteriaceae bacterium]